MKSNTTHQCKNMNYWYNQDETQKHYAEPKQTDTIELYKVVWSSRTKLCKLLENFKLPTWFLLYFYLTEMLWNKKTDEISGYKKSDQRLPVWA